MTNSSSALPGAPLPQPYGDPNTDPAPPGRSPRSSTTVVIDVVIGTLAWLGLLGFGSLAVFYSFFFAMATDACFTGSDCREDLVGPAMMSIWVAVGLAWLTALIGTIVSTVRRRMFFYWPLIGLVITFIGVVIGMQIIEKVNP
ncbi:MAG: hypothetical protein WBA38_16165 [Gordonia sp. (in: high G+C Gram-positive bacteria)]|uniref:hypothetical protein n=1 Tax=Gordonia sp. (in: high G+C Gram-positive bacteria) TaxID=84139 RepID=UPI003C77CB9C